MDARQTSGVNFSFNAFHPSLALISPTLQRAPLCPVGEANFNASEKGQTWPYYFALPLCACPRNATGHYHFPPLSSPFITSPMNPIPRCTGLPYPKSSNWKLEQASRDSRSRGESFERWWCESCTPSGKWLHLHSSCWNSSCFGVRFIGKWNVSTALHCQYSLVGNDFYWKIYSENKYIVSRSST